MRGSTGDGNSANCPLCGSGPWLAAFDTGKAGGNRPAHHCPECGLVYISPLALPDPETERIRYSLHRNSPDDDGYVRFLSRIVDFMEECSSIKERVGEDVLDYGCGPEPVLGRMLKKRGYTVSLYDPLFRPDTGLFANKYGVVFCTEAAEHFHRPGIEFDRLADLMAAGGILALITRLLQSPEQFRDWEYASDITHVSFYSPHTIRWIAGRYGWSYRIRGCDLIVFQSGD